MKSDQTTKPFYPYYMTGSNIVLSRYLVRTTDGHGNHYLCCYVLFRTKSNQLSIATAWVKWIRFPNVSNKNKINVDFSKWYFNFYYPNQISQYGYFKTINKRDTLFKIS